MICKQCGKEFETNRDWQVFCCDKCRDLYHTKERKEAMMLYKQSIKKASQNHE